MNAGAADEAGVLVAFGGVADQAGGFIDDQQVGVFVENLKQFFQARFILTTDERGGTQIFQRRPEPGQMGRKFRRIRNH